MKHIIFAVTFILMQSAVGTATATDGISSLKITNHRFTDQVSGTSKLIANSPGVLLVLDVKAEIVSEKVTLFSEDFVLRYYPKSFEKRSACVGIGTNKKIQTRKGTIWLEKGIREDFLLVFWLNAKSDKIDLTRAGSSEIVSYVFSNNQSRLSIYIVTNKISEEVEKIAEALEKEGSYAEVSLSPTLAKNVGKNNITIHYTTLAQSKAQQISSMFEQFKLPINMKPLRLNTSHDIVIWLSR